MQLSEAEIRALLDEHIVTFGGYMVQGKDIAAHAIAERMKEGVVREKEGMVVEEPDYYEDDQRSISCIAYAVYVDGKPMFALGDDYHDPEMARLIHDGQLVSVTVRLEGEDGQKVDSR